MKNFFNYTRSEIANLAGRTARANRLYRAVYRNGVREFDSAAGLIASDLHLAAETFSLEVPAIVHRFRSKDGTRRFLIRLEDGETVESVTILEDGRSTFCVSSQVGCALGCKFCLTGKMGLTRNLTAGEIVSQVMLQRRDLSLANSDRFSVVLMGMGEPLQNYENVIKAIQILNDDHGLNLSVHRITLSTSGLLPEIKRLAQETLFPNLSISLTGATNVIRDELMPINRRYPIQEVIQAIQELPPQRRKRVMFEYVMIKEVTDSVDDAKHLSKLLHGLGAKVNLIPMNESPEIGFQQAEYSDILRFQQVLIGNGITTFIRKTRGNDISGACGQLKRDVPLMSW